MAARAKNWSGVEAAIRSAEATGTRVGVAAIARSGERFAHQAGERFAAASTIKICIMIELFRQIDAGRHTLDARRTMQDADRANGSGVMRHLHAKMEFTLNDLCYLMMSISDNTATNMLIDVVGGMEPVNAMMRGMGMARSVLGRKMGFFNLGPGHENYAVPDEFADAIAAILGNRAASAGSCAAMVAMLEKQQNDRRIARHLPKGDDAPRWGTKTGSMTGVTNDVGFVMTGSGPLIVSIYTAEQPDRNLAEAQIGGIARAALEAVG
jgi:beta-lactamase class A